MAANLGVNVVEVDGQAAPTVAQAGTSVAGLLVRSERGAPDTPVLVRGFGEFTTRFGAYAPDAFGAHAVRGFFDNGGAEAYVVRVIGDGARAASVDLLDGESTPVLTVRAGQHGRVDPGAWGNALTVTVEDHPRGDTLVPAHVVGTAAEPFAAPTDAPITVTLTTRGDDTAVPIRLDDTDFATPAAASAEEVARAINRRTTAVRATPVPGGRLVLSAAQTDPTAWTRLTVEGADALGIADDATSDDAIAPGATAAPVELAAGFVPGSVVRIATRGHVVGGALAATVEDGAGFVVAADGGDGELVVLEESDFADPTAITAAEVAAAVNRQIVRATAALTPDGHLALLSRREGAGSTIALADPSTGVANAREALGLDDADPVAGAEAPQTLTAASESYRMLSWSGTPALPALSAPVTRITSTEFDLAVRRDDEEVERFAQLSMIHTDTAHAIAVVNDPASGSAHVVLEAHDPDPAVDPNRPATGTFPLGETTATGGRDGGVPSDTALIGEPTKRTGLEALGDVAVQLVACPETTSAAFAQAAIAWCERRGDAMFVGTVPPGLDRDGTKAYAAGLRVRKAYGALYAPWIEVRNPLPGATASPTVAIPPVGQVLGVYARVAATRGPWKAPAGDEARLVDAVGVEYEMTDADHTDLVRVGAVNGIRPVAGAGIVVDASRTLSTDARWLYVNVRRLFNLVKSSLRDGLTFVQQEPHTEELRRSVAFNVVQPFLLGLWRQGAFGSAAPEDVFTVRCDATNNPPTDVALGIFTLEVLFYPTRPVESILVVVGQQDSGASATEA